MPQRACSARDMVSLTPRNMGAYKLITPLLDTDIATNPHSNVQTLYEASLCAWLLSFDEKARKQALTSDNAIIIKKLINVARNATKEKVVRMAVMALKNILISATNDDDEDDNSKKANNENGK